MPILKYMVVIGVLLLALIVGAERMLGPAAKAGETSQSSSLELLRKMANHGDIRHRASAAAAGPFLAMPSVIEQHTVGASPTPASINPPATPVASSSMNAQARLAEADVNAKTIRPAPAKKVVNRKPKQRVAYVANVQRISGSFLGAFEPW